MINGLIMLNKSPEDRVLTYQIYPGPVLRPSTGLDSKDRVCKVYQVLLFVRVCVFTILAEMLVKVKKKIQNYRSNKNT